MNVSKGKPTVPVPDATGQSQDSATALLRSYGFKVSVKKQSTTDPGEDGLVVSQTPAVGTLAPKGSTVTIFVGQLVGGTTGP